MGRREPSDEKKRAEALRVRKYREAQKADLKLLEAEQRHWAEMLERLKASQKNDRRSKSARSRPSALAMDLSRRQNKALRNQVGEYDELLHLLETWVASQQLTQGPSHLRAWTESTLMAHPAARRQGYHWLSERVYHNATIAVPEHPFGIRVDDAAQFKLHTSDDVDGGASIVGMEVHVQHTYFSNFKTVANLVWSFGQKNSAVKAYLASQVLEEVDDHTVYSSGVYDGTRTNVRRIISIFEGADRIVITHALVTDDELHPMAPGELRTHGFAWTIVERVTDEISLMRHSTFHFAPMSSQGVVSQAELGQLFGKDPDDIRHRDAFIEQVGGVAEATYVNGLQKFALKLGEAVDQLSG
ncbi:Aste57867_4987 [Aphanomyces stellatus]|uniref:Aste57867_4987 protein n=1 Tax=Aphanomyces stellatus TaxID=120398 RepID=A0A485KDK6_9STRA|nr:hypothetical protein As57867_004974 [Aphanomyces stellatus]VFT82073.1 Aste57867_4987 [Aphanomyces stellatus]